MVASTPSNITSVNNAPEPPLEHIATSAPSICVRRARAAQLLDAADHALQHLRRRAGVAVRHHAAVGGDRVLPARLDRAAHHEVATLALAAEPERLELADDLERERVVELAHVDVGGPQPGGAERVLRGAPPDGAVHQVGAPVATELPRRRVLVRGPPLSLLPPRTYTGCCGRVGGEVGAGEHDAAPAFRRGRAVEEVERVGDHAAVEDVLRRERPAAVVDRLGVARARCCGSPRRPSPARRAWCRTCACAGGPRARTPRR